jgi:Raf kinase inhibitor-like YbhB/YbcL family protein
MWTPATIGRAVVILLLVAACGSEPSSGRSGAGTGAGEEQGVSFSLRSSAFRDGEAIPARYTCDGENVSPALSWDTVPDGSGALVLVMDDPDAPRGTFTHWVLFDIPPEARELPEAITPRAALDDGARQGPNDFGNLGYGGPCPPPGAPHHYRFTLYAVDAPLRLAPGATKQEVTSALSGPTIGSARLVGTYRR